MRPSGSAASCQTFETLAGRHLQHALHEGEFRIGVGIAIEPVELGQSTLELCVFIREDDIASQEVTKGEPFKPEVAAIRDEMKVMRSNRGRRLAKPMHDLSAVWHVQIPKLRKHRECGTRGLEIANRDHDVDYGLRIETRHGGASDVLDLAIEPWHQAFAEQGAFALELSRPTRVVRHNLDGSVLGHDGGSG